MKVHVISLDRTPERYQEFLRWNAGAKLEVDRFPAVDGQTLDKAELVRQGLITADLAYLPGALGIAMSHLALWRKAARENVSVTVCEDDAIFNHHFPEEAAALISRLPPDWDMVMWGWNFDHPLWVDMIPGVSNCRLHFSESALRAGIGRYQAQYFLLGLRKLIASFGLPCYTVSAKGASSLIQFCLPLRPQQIIVPDATGPLKNVGIDVVMNAWYPKGTAFACLPPLVVTLNNTSLSTISPQRFTR